MNKRILSLLLCIVLAASTVLAGCGNKKVSSSGSSNGKKDELITIDVFDTLANYQGIQSGWFAKVVKDKFNMELNIIAPNVAGGGDTLFQTRSAAGNLGDLIISKTENGRFENMVKAGLLMDMTNLLKDKAVLSNYKEAIEIMNANLEPEGIYGIPGEISNQSPLVSTEGIDPLVAPYVRWDSYKAIGYPAMESLEDWIPVMKSMQESTPKSDSGKKTYAISLFKDWDDNMMVGAKNYASLYGYNEIGFVLVKADGSDKQDITSSDGYYVKALEFLFHANQAGVIDPESTTQNYDILSDKYRDGQILTSLWSFQGPSYYNTVERKNSGKGFMPAYIKGISPFSFGCYPKGNGKTIIAIGSQTKHPERIAEFIDWLYSPEGMEIAGQANGAAGIEGLTWEMKDGKAVYTEFGEKALPNNDIPVPEEWGGGSWKDGVCALNFKALSIVDMDPRINEPYLTSMWSSELAKRTTPLDIDWQEKSGGAKTTIEFLVRKDALSVAAGTSYLQPEESSDITTLRGQCKAVIVDDSWKMIFAKDEEEFNSILKHMQDTVKGLGYEQVLKVDMKNANDLAASRIEAVEEYNNKVK